MTKGRAMCLKAVVESEFTSEYVAPEATEMAVSMTAKSVARALPILPFNIRHLDA
jgi:hypothetical protein